MPELTVGLPASDTMPAKDEYKAIWPKDYHTCGCQPRDVHRLQLEGWQYYFSMLSLSLETSLGFDEVI
jgi:hypothetical protein